MRGQDRPLEGVSVGGRPLNNPLQLTHVGTHISEEAHENVSERPQLAKKVVQADNNRQGNLSPTGQAVHISEAGVLGPDVRKGQCDRHTPVPHALDRGPCRDASRRTGQVITIIDKAPPRDRVKEGEVDVKKVSVATKLGLACAHPY